MIELWLRKHWKTLLLLLGFIGLAILYWMPLSLHMGSNIFDPEFGDSAFNMWILGWGNHILTHAPWKFFEAPMFYPYSHVLAWGDHLFSVSLVTLPLVPIFGILATYNMVLVGSSALSGFTLYLLTNYLTKNKAAAFIAGSMWMLTSSHVAQAYIQILPMWWLPLIFLLAEKIRRGDTKNKPWWLALVIFLQLTTGIYIAMYAAITFGIYVAVLALTKQLKMPVFKTYLMSWLVAGLAALPIYAPSLILNFARPTVRSLNEQAALSWANINPLHIPGSLWSRLVVALGKTPSQQVAIYSLGILLSTIVLIGAAYGAWKLVKTKKLAKRQALPATFFIIGLFALLAAMGPYIVLPVVGRVKNIFFLAPYVLVPGFKVMRLTLRWQFIAVFGFAVFSAYLIAGPLRKLRSWQQILIVVLAVSIIVIDQTPWNSVGSSKAPKLSDDQVYTWLSKQPGNFAVAELPIYAGVYFGKNDVMEGRRLYFQTLSGFHPKVSGAFSPFTPKGYPSKAAEFNAIGEKPESVKIYHDNNVKYVLYLPNDYKTLGWGAETAAIKKKQLDAAPYLRKVLETKDGSVYQVL